jgi:hypothetical protein
VREKQREMERFWFDREEDVHNRMAVAAGTASYKLNSVDLQKAFSF